MTIPANQRDSGKYAIKVLAVLFTNDELASGILFAWPSSKRIPLNPYRVSIMFGGSDNCICMVAITLQYSKLSILFVVLF